MTAAAEALRKAIFARLAGDPAVTGLLGGGRVYDETPRGETSPCVILGEGSVKDYSSVAVAGHEHLVTLAVWSVAPGTRETFAIADAVVASLEALGPTLDGHRLINLVALATEVKREPDRQRTRGTIRLRAVTETL